MRRRWDDDDDAALIELARLNIKANIEFDLGMFYSPQEIDEVKVVMSAPTVTAAEGKRLRVRVSVIVEAEDD